MLVCLKLRSSPFNSINSISKWLLCCSVYSEWTNTFLLLLFCPVSPSHSLTLTYSWVKCYQMWLLIELHWYEIYIKYSLHIKITIKTNSTENVSMNTLKLMHFSMASSQFTNNPKKKIIIIIIIITSAGGCKNIHQTIITCNLSIYFFQDYFYCPLTAALQVLNDTTVKH